MKVRKIQGCFTELGKYFSQEFVGRGACIGDYDNDGDMDVFVVNLNSHCAFLRNNKGTRITGYMLSLTGTSGKQGRIGHGSRLHRRGKHSCPEKNNNRLSLPK
jgi:hypothetical protein